MASFIHPGFLFSSKRGERLYHDWSENLPLIDFHCHLSPAMIADNSRFENITQAWLDGDHYKWRAMRMNGVPERYCTGDAKPEEKFMKWAATVPYTAGNPLYHWTHLELARYFGSFRLLNTGSAPSIYEETSSFLRSGDMSTRSIIRKMKVELICTTDDPTDSLEYHQKLSKDFEIKVLPAFRPDNAVKTGDPGKFNKWITKLAGISGLEIRNIATFIDALEKRHEFFHRMGCRLSDHGLENMFFTSAPGRMAERAFRKLINGKAADSEEAEAFGFVVMSELCTMNYKRGWVQQFHLGAMRNNNARMFMELGPDTGWDSIGPVLDPLKISGFLSHLDKEGSLARTILYNLNPADNEMMITMAGNFCDGSAAGKIQYGAPWWFLDQKNGIEKHLRDLSSLGLISRFVGMVTDSRSFLSYPRHEYFRRIACNFIGEEVEKGLIPDDEGLLKMIVEGISYRNAKEYFSFI